jgi:dihydrofolate reductase
MRKLFLFEWVSADGYFEGANHDTSWFMDRGEAFDADQVKQTDTLLFGHTTYNDMRSFWSTPQAFETAPVIARYMNETRKVVVSHQPFDPAWENVTVISGDVESGIRTLKSEPGGAICTLGSNTLCVSLLQLGLMDELNVLVNPIVLGTGTPLFKGMPKRIELKLVGSRQLKSGPVLLTYQPVYR